MSHFACIVIISGGPEDAEDSVEVLLENYDENMEVEEYKTICHCVGRTAYHEVGRMVDGEMGTMDSARAAFHSRYAVQLTSSPSGNAKLDKLWEDEVTHPRHIRVMELLRRHQLYNTPNPECDYCNGTGHHASNTNPNGKWDYWEAIGTGLVTHLIGGNTIPFAVVTPDGEWHERGSMGSWGLAADEKPAEVWDAIVGGIYEEYRECTYVMCDLHT